MRTYEPGTYSERMNINNKIIDGVEYSLWTYDSKVEINRLKKRYKSIRPDISIRTFKYKYNGKILYFMFVRKDQRIQLGVIGNGKRYKD